MSDDQDPFSHGCQDAQVFAGTHTYTHFLSGLPHLQLQLSFAAGAIIVIIITIMTNVNLTTICWVLSPLQLWLGLKSTPFVFKLLPKKWRVILKEWRQLVSLLLHHGWKHWKQRLCASVLTCYQMPVCYIFAFTALLDLPCDWHVKHRHLQCHAFIFWWAL